MAAVTSLMLDRSIRLPGEAASYNEFHAPEFDIQMNDDFFLIQRKGAHKCVPLSRALEWEMALAEDLVERGFVVANEGDAVVPSAPPSRKKARR